MSSQPAQSPAYSAVHSPAHSPAKAEPKTHCVKGHARFLFGVDEWGGCNECRRIRQKNYKDRVRDKERQERLLTGAKARGGRRHGQQYRRGYETIAAVEALNNEILALIDKHELASAAEWRDIKAQIAELTKEKDRLERGGK